MKNPTPPDVTQCCDRPENWTGLKGLWFRIRRWVYRVFFAPKIVCGKFEPFQFPNIKKPYPPLDSRMFVSTPHDEPEDCPAAQGEVYSPLYITPDVYGNLSDDTKKTMREGQKKADRINRKNGWEIPERNEE